MDSSNILDFCTIYKIRTLANFEKVFVFREKLAENYLFINKTKCKVRSKNKFSSSADCRLWLLFIKN